MRERTDIWGVSAEILRMFLLLFIVVEYITENTNERVFFYHEEFCGDLCQSMCDDHISLTLEDI